MMRNRIFFPVYLWFALTPGFAAVGFAQARSPKEEILGIWHGTSICTKIPGNESCHDETVVYEFSDSTGRADTVTLTADKVVNGRIVPMGVLDFGFDAKNHRWIAEFRNSRVHILWSYTVHGQAMSGTCSDMPTGVIWRNVAARKDRKHQ